MAPAALEIRDIAKSYGDRAAVRGVSFSIAPGEILGLLGPNGAGKTTLIRIALDIIRPDRGEVRLFGAPITRAARDRVGYLPEERGLYQRARVFEVLRYAGRLRGLSAGDANARAGEALARVGLAAVARKRVRELSKGMQQKLQLAATVIHGPDLLILDEPLSGLDPVNRRLVRELIRAEAARGAAVILSSHQMDIVEQLCHRAVLIHGGVAVLEGPVRALGERGGRNEVLVSLRAGSFAAVAELMADRAAVGTPGAPLERVTLRDGVTPEGFLAALIAAGASIDHFERALPSLEDIFVEAVGGPVPLEHDDVEAAA